MIIEKGDELRSRVSQTASATREQVAGLTHRVQQQVGELADEVANGVGALRRRGHDYVQDRMERVERTAEAAQRAVQETWSEPA